MKTLWLARDEDGSLYLFNNKPIKGERCWISSQYGTEYDVLEVQKDLFPEITWDDDDPVEVELTVI